MKQFFGMLTVFILSIYVSQSAAKPPEVLHLVANEWEPYTGAQLKNKGLSSDLVSTALRRAGYDVEITIAPWTRALKGVEAGNYHGIIAIWYTEERDQTMKFSTPYMTNDVVLFKRIKDDIRYNDLADLEGKTIGVIRDYAYGRDFDENKTLNKKTGLDLRTNIVRLAKGIVDLVPDDRFVMSHTLNINYPEYKNALAVLDKPLSQRTLHMTISRNVDGFEKIVADFNRELKAMKQEGLFEVMLKKHNLNF